MTTRVHAWNALWKFHRIQLAVLALLLPATLLFAPRHASQESYWSGLVARFNSALFWKSVLICDVVVVPFFFCFLVAVFYLGRLLDTKTKG